jgi:hypothetical protein
MAKNEGKHYRFMQLEFYAQRGMITIIDLDAASDSTVEADVAINRVPPGQFMKRAIAVRMGCDDKYSDEVRGVNNFMDQAVAACKLAKAQGDPTDGKVIDHVVKHSRKSSIVMPGDAGHGIMGAGLTMSQAQAAARVGPVGGQRFKVRLGKPRDMLKNGVDVVPDFSIKHGDMLTPSAANALRKKKRVRS